MQILKKINLNLAHVFWQLIHIITKNKRTKAIISCISSYMSLSELKTVKKDLIEKVQIPGILVYLKSDTVAS